jgi:hypothetical protein
VFIASRHDHSGDFFCKGSNQVLRSRNEVPLLGGTHLQVLCKLCSFMLSDIQLNYAQNQMFHNFSGFASNKSS